MMLEIEATPSTTLTTPWTANKPKAGPRPPPGAPSEAWCRIGVAISRTLIYSAQRISPRMGRIASVYQSLDATQHKGQQERYPPKAASNLHRSVCQIPNHRHTGPLRRIRQRQRVPYVAINGTSSNKYSTTNK